MNAPKISTEPNTDVNVPPAKDAKTCKTDEKHLQARIINAGWHAQANVDLMKLIELGPKPFIPPNVNGIGDSATLIISSIMRVNSCDTI